MCGTGPWFGVEDGHGLGICPELPEVLQYIDGTKEEGERAKNAEHCATDGSEDLACARDFDDFVLGHLDDFDDDVFIRKCHHLVTLGQGDGVVPSGCGHVLVEAYHLHCNVRVFTEELVEATGA